MSTKAIQIDKVRQNIRQKLKFKLPRLHIPTTYKAYSLILQIEDLIK